MKENRYILPDDKAPAFASETEAAYIRNAKVAFPEEYLDEFDQDNMGWRELPVIGPTSLDEAYARIEQAEEEYKQGECMEVENFEQKIEEKFPWLA